jgi:hypothetical protein
MRRTEDRRYGNRRWKRVRLRVLARDGYRCQVEDGCPMRATVADHVDPVGPHTTDAEFYDEVGLRAACMMHNVWRARLERAREGRSLGADVGRQQARHHLHTQGGSVFDRRTSPARVYGGRP